MPFVSYAQNREDALLWRALGHVDQGFFIDVGAGDPDHETVTKAFSLAGWRGVNVEPSPQSFPTLAERRPNETNLNVLVGREPGRATFYSVGRGNGLSTTVEAYARSYQNGAWPVDEIEIECVTLAQICEEHAPADIHFLKVDVEGGELEVLSGADFGRFRPWVVMVEAITPLVLRRPDGSLVDSPGTARAAYEDWEPLLVGAGYTFTLFDGLNRVYVANEQLDALGPALSAPVCVLDDVVSPTDLRYEGEIDVLYQELYESSRAMSALAARLQAAEQSAEDRIAAIYATRSWRITKPLRGLTYLKGRLRSALHG